MPFTRKYRTALSNAFDVYLTILQKVDALVAHALGRDTPDWRVLNACPPCGYEVRYIFFITFVSDGTLAKRRGTP